LHLELRQAAQATAALQKYLQVAQAGAGPTAQPEASEADDDDETVSSDVGLLQAYLLLAQAAELQGDFAQAERWLAKVDSPQRALEVQARRASLLARQGKVDEARALIRKAPEKTPADARAKLLSEAQMLRDVKQWADAYAVLAAANEKYPNDADLLYEQSMVAEKLDRMEEMEQLLRRVMEIQPDYHHAYNALGYSLADRNLRLEEARALIRKALELKPGEPFITDSLGWVEYRLGNREEATRLLRQAYQSRPDTEIAVHLGEVLWVSGQRDEARRILRDARGRDAGNEVLRETLARLQVDL
jgi:Flp pilus assembly protein TadD